MKTSTHITKTTTTYNQIKCKWHAMILNISLFVNSKHCHSKLWLTNCFQLIVKLSLMYMTMDHHRYTYNLGFPSDQLPSHHVPRTTTSTPSTMDLPPVTSLLPHHQPHLLPSLPPAVDGTYLEPLDPKGPPHQVFKLILSNKLMQRQTVHTTSTVNQ